MHGSIPSTGGSIARLCRRAGRRLRELGRSAPSGTAEQPRHVIFIADEPFLPTDHGGRMAMANDVKALKAAGFTVSLIVSVETPQLTDTADHYSFEFVSPVHFALRRPLDVAAQTHPELPRAASVRLPDDEGLLALRAFLDTQPIPRAIIASRESSLPLGRWIADSSRAPLVLRSHNDEVEYAGELARNTADDAEAGELRAEADRLERGLGALLAPVHAVALISPDDATRYNAAGRSARLVPAFTAEVNEASAGFAERRQRACFVGSLTMPHTAAGLLWYVEHVWPEVHRVLPAAELAIAGRGAQPALVDAFGRAGGIVYLGRVDTVQPVLDSARVFVNPVFGGSGVSMKLVQPIADGLPVVATRIGLRGLAEFSAVVQPSDDAEALALQTIRYLRDRNAWERASRDLRDVMAGTHSRAAAAEAWQQLIALLPPREAIGS